MPGFQANLPAHSPQFVNQAEEECARILDFYGLRWEYEPRSFVLEEDEEGRVLEAFTPDFYLPAQQPAFRAFAGSVPPRFVNEVELECAKMLDYYGVPWEYEPTTFVLGRDEEGRVTSAFTPDFYLPEQDLYLEVTVMKQSLVTRKNRKIRKLRARYPDVKIKLFTRRDFERLADKYGLNLA